MDSTAMLSNEQLAFVATRAFAKLWVPRGAGLVSLQPFQTFCTELLRSTQISMPIVMLALLYVNRFKRKFPHLHGGNGSEYRMFVVALMLASKSLEDNTFTTQTWSEVSHLPARELAIMQRELLTALDHRLHVTEADYSAWIEKLQMIIVGGTGIQMSQPPSPAANEAQVVPSPRFHDIPAYEQLPSPSAKRMRFAGKPQQLAIDPSPAVSASALQFVQQPQMYTPPSSAGVVGFGPGDFTFTVPAMPPYLQQQGSNSFYLARPQSAATAAAAGLVVPPATHHHQPTFGAAAGFPPQGLAVSHPHHHMALPVAATSGWPCHQQRRQPSLPTSAVAAAASALATRYPGMCYGASSGFNPATTLPIYH
ncbi:hypothetical protein GGF46_002750 [Coemansia sp. RSA 552]|nr:hypothetical protein GGF46_002750 [Coemansia sp. RSA 552]